ncbi:MAG: class I SAM-dependent methyltransferase [Candidatus Heimdallarchaeaceae archaeon]
MDKSVKFWDSKADSYDKPSSQPRTTPIKAIEMTTPYLEENNVVLDYGCATGKRTNVLAENVKEVWGIDISPKMIEEASRRASDNSIENVQYMHATIFDERLETGSFDAIVAYSVLHLVDDLDNVIQRINELLKPGGVFISETPSLGEKKSLLSSIMYLLSKTRFFPSITFLSYSQLESLITESNFLIAKTEIMEPKPPVYFVVAKKN